MLSKTLFVFFALLSSSSAFPNGAGFCARGRDAIMTPGLPHSTNRQVGGMDLADVGLVVSLDDEIMDPSQPFDFIIDRDYKLSITSTQNTTTFRGFLMRLDANDADVFTYDYLKARGDDIKLSFLCRTVELVGGLTHTTRNDKESVAGTLNVDRETMGMALDVTVVLRNSNTENLSEWYFSTYTMNAIFMDPTSAPAIAPITTAPVSSMEPSIPKPNTTIPPTAVPTNVRAISAIENEGEHDTSGTGRYHTLSSLLVCTVAFAFIFWR